MGGAAAIALGLGLAACATPLRDAAPMVASTTTAGGPAPAYLDVGRRQALAASIPPPPAGDSAAARADIAASERLRALENTDRWLLATRHAELRPALALSHFDCALGFRLTAADSPRLVALLERVLHDANETAELAKASAHRPRPVAANPDRPACQVASAVGRASASYPSGSAAVGAAYGAAFAALIPEQADALNRIGHEIAVSRMVCGMHYPSDVMTGEDLGRAVFGAIAATPAFAAEAAGARQEIAAARARGLTSPACAAERAALAIPLP